jgi:pimeloyl-ACP methyl ester carboxylesterase
MEHVKTNGVVLATHTWPGDGPPVLAVHGLTANHTCWYPLAGVLGGRVRLTAYDLRGRGDSEKPPTGYSLEQHARDLLGLLDHLGAPRATVMGHSLGAHVAVWFAAHYPERVDRLVLFDGGLDVRAEVFASLKPAIDRLGIEFPSLDVFLGMLQQLPLFAGRWSEHVTRYFTYDVEPAPGGGVRSKVARHAIEEELANLQLTRLWVLHHTIKAATLLLRAPDGLLTATDCLMTQDEAEAMQHAIADCRLVVVPGTNHYTIVLGDNPTVAAELTGFLRV